MQVLTLWQHLQLPSCQASPSTELLVGVPLEAAYVCSCHGQPPHVAVDQPLNAPAQVLPRGGIVTRPVGGVAARAWKGGPV